MSITKEELEIEETLNKKIKDNDYLFFNGSDEVFINDLSSSIKITDLLSFIRNN